MPFLDLFLDASMRLPTFPSHLPPRSPSFFSFLYLFLRLCCPWHLPCIACPFLLQSPQRPQNGNTSQLMTGPKVLRMLRVFFSALRLRVAKRSSIFSGSKTFQNALQLQLLQQSSSFLSPLFYFPFLCHPFLFALRGTHPLSFTLPPPV